MAVMVCALGEEVRHARRGNGFEERVVDVVVCLAPRKIFVALLKVQQSRLYLDRLCLRVATNCLYC